MHVSSVKKKKHIYFVPYCSLTIWLSCKQYYCVVATLTLQSGLNQNQDPFRNICIYASAFYFCNLQHFTHRLPINIIKVNISKVFMPVINFLSCDSLFSGKRLCLRTQLNNPFYPTHSHSLSSFKQMAFDRASVSENALSALYSLMRSLFWSPDTAFTSSQQLFPHLLLKSSATILLSRPFYQSFTNSTYCLSLNRPPLPLAAVYPPSIHVSLSLFSDVILPTGKTHSFLLYPFFFILAFFLFSLCFPCGFHLHYFAVLLASGNVFVFLFFKFINSVKPSTLPWAAIN